MSRPNNGTQRWIIAIFFLAFFGCVVGWGYEMLFYRISLGYFIKRGQAIGPWLPIYGFGMIGVVVATYRKKLPAAVIFLISAIGSGVLELVVGMLLFHFGGGLRLWNYNIERWNFGNIGGYICLRSVVMFGILGLLCARFVIPNGIRWVQKANMRFLACVSIPLAVVVTLDLTYGYVIKPLWGLISR